VVIFHHRPHRPQLSPPGLIFRRAGCGFQPAVKYTSVNPRGSVFKHPWQNHRSRWSPECEASWRNHRAPVTEGLQLSPPGLIFRRAGCGFQPAVLYDSINPWGCGVRKFLPEFNQRSPGLIFRRAGCGFQPAVKYTSVNSRGSVLF
jgi:hypothetical protein